MGLYGSEYWTYVLPRRVGAGEAANLTARCLPIDAAEAARIGLVDGVLRAEPAEFDAAVLDEAVATRRPPRSPAVARRQASARRAPPMSCTSHSTPTGPRSSPR